MRSKSIKTAAMKITKLPQSKSVWAELDGVKELNNPKYDNIKITNDEYKPINDKYDFSEGGEWQWGTHSAEEAREEYDQIRKGYLNEKNAKRYEDIRRKAMGKESTTAIAPLARRRRRRNEYDGEICIDSYLAGSTDYYRKVNKVKTQNRVVRVVIGATLNAGTSAEDFARYNTYALAEVDKLMREGKMVEVYMAFTGKEVFTSREYPNGFALIKIKEADKGADLHRMRSSSLISFARYASFRAIQVVAHETDLDISYGLGQSINTEQNTGFLKPFIKEASNQLNSEVIYFDGASELGRKGISSKDC